MYVRIADLTIAQGVADDLLNRISSDLVPTYSASSGFIAYYAIKLSDTSATTIRVFEDATSLAAADQAAGSVLNQLANDFQLSNSAHADAVAAVASAFGRIHTP